MAYEEILIETTKYGPALRVVAIHVATGTEIVFQTPLNTGRPAIQKLALEKMRYVLEKRKN